jgi:hypothetical protein
VGPPPARQARLMMITGAREIGHYASGGTSVIEAARRLRHLLRPGGAQRLAFSWNCQRAWTTTERWLAFKAVAMSYLPRSMLSRLAFRARARPRWSWDRRGALRVGTRTADDTGLPPVRSRLQRQRLGASGAVGLCELAGLGYPSRGDGGGPASEPERTLSQFWEVRVGAERGLQRGVSVRSGSDAAELA